MFPFAQACQSPKASVSGSPPLVTPPLLSLSLPARFHGPPWLSIITSSSVNMVLTERNIMCKRDIRGVSHQSLCNMMLKISYYF